MSHRIILLLLILAAFTLTPAVAQSGGVIVFSTRSPNQLYQINSDGTGLTMLLNNLRAPGIPVWSPDGQHLAFGMDSAILMLDMADLTTTPIEVPHAIVTNVSDANLAWTPDGEQLYFKRFLNGANFVYSINPDGSGERRVSLLPAGPGAIRVLSDGRIAFQTEVENHFQPMVVVNPDGGDPVYFMVEDGSEQYQACGFDWSPIEFQVVISIVTEEAACVSVSGPPYSNPDGDTVLHPLLLTDAGYPYFYGYSWSPDGSRIAAATYELVPVGYYAFAPDRTDLRYIGGEIVQPEADQVFSPRLSNVSWSPDSRQLTFAWSYGDPAGAVLYVAEADGSGSTPIITFNPDIVNIVGVTWQPLR